MSRIWGRGAWALGMVKGGPTFFTSFTICTPETLASAPAFPMEDEAILSSSSSALGMSFRAHPLIFAPSKATTSRTDAQKTNPIRIVQTKKLFLHPFPSIFWLVATAQ